MGNQRKPDGKRKWADESSRGQTVSMAEGPMRPRGWALVEGSQPRLPLRENAHYLWAQILNCKQLLVPLAGTGN